MRGNMILTLYKGLIFDMDGTLIDSLPAHFSAWEKACQDFDLPFEREWVFSLTGSHRLAIADAIIQRYRCDVDAGKLAATKTRYFEAIEDKGAIIPATFSVLKQWAGRKKMAIATGSQRDSAYPLLDKAGVLPWIDVLVTASDVTKTKPDPESFLLAAQQLGIAPHECLVFEDAPFGFQAAQAAGMDHVPVIKGKIQPIVFSRCQKTV